MPSRRLAGPGVKWGAVLDRGSLGPTVAAGAGGVIRQEVRGMAGGCDFRGVRSGGRADGRTVEAEALSRNEASKLINGRDRAIAQYVRRFHGVEWADPLLYHLTLNTSLLSPATALELIAAAARQLDAQASAAPSGLEA